jgi:hypothetical protein
MSLIVDINPVPWKILELVRARILKNRAKKAKDGSDFSKETVKRVSSLQVGPLSKKRKEESSFVLDSGIHYSITIIDEDDNTAQNLQDIDWSAWSDKTIFQFQDELTGDQQLTYLASREDKMFILLIPNNNVNALMYYPIQWPRLAGSTSQDPYGVAILVARSVGSSNYYALIQDATGVSWSSVESVYIAVDASGSMTRDTVAADLDYFRNNLSNSQIPFMEIQFGEERWIYPHSGPS